MTESDITVSILREIRDGIRTLDANLSGRIDATNNRIEILTERVDGLTERVDGLTERVDVLTERVNVVVDAVQDNATQTLLLTRYLKNRTEVDIAELRDRTESELESLRDRVTKLEAKAE